MNKSEERVRYVKKLFIPFIILSFSIFNNVYAYTMPVGIPDSSIDFTQDAPQRPDDWSEEIPGYYYIDAQNGSTSVTYGSETTPRKSLPTNPVPAGSYIEIAGEFSISSYKILEVNGTDDIWVANTSGPVWITQSEVTPGVITGGRLILTGENVFITNLNFKEGGKPQVGSPTEGYDIKNIVIRDSDIAGSNLAGTGLAINRATNAIIYNNTIHDFGDIYTTIDEDAHVINIGTYNNNIWVLSNKQHTASGAGLQVLGDSETTSNIFVGDNEVYNVRQSGIWLKGGKNVVFSSNYVHDIIDTAWSVSKGMGAQYVPDGLWMINNHIEGAEYGIRIASTSATDFAQNIYIIGNVIHNISEKSEVGYVGSSNNWQTTGIHIVGGTEIWIYNNLIFDAPNGVISSSQLASLHIKNNIIFDLTNSQETGNYGRSIWSEFVSKLGDTIELTNNYFDDHMLVEQAGKSYFSIAEVESQGGINNYSETQYLSDTELENIINNKSITGYDSTAITDMGTDISAITETLYSTIFTNVTSQLDTDILGMQRTQGNNIDIGPFETSGTASTVSSSAPASPTILDIIQVEISTE